METKMYNVWILCIDPMDSCPYWWARCHVCNVNACKLLADTATASMGNIKTLALFLKIREATSRLN